MPRRAYICSPLSGDIEGNIGRAKGYCRIAMDMGYVPYASHVYFTSFLDDTDPEQRAVGTREGLFWLAMCQEVFVFGDRISEGMAAELELASKLGLPITYFDASGNPVGTMFGAAFAAEARP